MAKRWGWLTPDAPAPETLRCRSISVPDDLAFVGAVSGALLDLTKAYNWEQFGTMTPEQAAEIMLYAVQEFLNDECSGGSCPRGWRVGVGGGIEFTEDGGETWQEGDDAVYEPLQSVDAPTPEERRCLAAANAVEVMRQTYVEVLNEFQETGAPQLALFAFSSVFALLFAGLIVPVTAIAAINAMLNFTIQSFVGALGLMEQLADDDWTEGFSERLQCALFDASTDTDGKVTFDFAAVQAEIGALLGDFDAGLIFWIFYIFTVIGAEGLNVAGTTTSIEEADCDVCDCSNGLELVPSTVDPAPGTIIEKIGECRWRITGYTNGAIDRRLGVKDATGGCINIVSITYVNAPTFNSKVNCAGSASSGSGGLGVGAQDWRWFVLTKSIASGSPPIIEIEAFRS